MDVPTVDAYLVDRKSATEILVESECFVRTIGNELYLVLQCYSCSGGGNRMKWQNTLRDWYGIDKAFFFRVLVSKIELAKMITNLP